MSTTLAAPANSEAPEQGQLVAVRGRRWIVSDVKRSAPRIEPLRRPDSPPQHLVTLSSVEDDGMGEELQVVWEIEPGAKTIESYGLPEPTGFDDPARLDAFLHAVRWGAVSSADVRALQAPFRSGIEIEDYQLDPVVRAIQMPRANLLIADDVGLGKTIEAGLVIQEFITRHRARRVLVICPSSLQIQWRDQMRDKFGLEFRIVDSDLMRDLRRRRGLHVNPWTHFPRLITSIDFIKRERPMRLMREVLPADGEPAYPRRFDILVVDEAHNVAPSGRGHYATDSQRTLAIRTLVRHFEHKLFLSATPHNGYEESFTALLELVDSQRFAAGVMPDEKQKAAVMVRRLKTELPPRWDGKPRFPKRVPKHLRVPYTQEERDVHAALQEYTALRRTTATTQEETFAAEFVLKLLKKRLFSSPAAFHRTLEKHVKSLREARRERERQRAKPSLGILKARAEQLEEEFDNDERYQEATDGFIETANLLFAKVSAEEEGLLRKMRAWAEHHEGKPDCKAKELLAWLRKVIKVAGRWSHERVIIFTEYRDTLNWLQRLLAAEGFTEGDRLMTLYGGMDPDKREQIKAAFQAGPDESPVRILLATDAASEGIDLQAHCHRLIHYEIPWNPNRMEQRNGRVDRYGQKADEVEVFHFVDATFKEEAPAEGSKPGDLAGDLEFLYRAVLKLQRMERDLFGKVAPVVAAQVEDAMLGKRRSLDTSQAERDAEPVRRMLKLERDLKRQIEKLHERLQDTRRELDVTPENSRLVVEVALDLAGQPPLVPAELAGVWPDPTGLRTVTPVFRLPQLRDSWAHCTEGLRHPHTGQTRPVTFDHAICVGRDDVVLIHLNHRLVQMSMRLLRAEVWSEAGRKRLHRVTARVVPDNVLQAPAVLVLARLVMVGGDGRRLHEEIIAGGGLLVGGGFRRLNVGQVDGALRESVIETIGQRLRESLVELWPKHRDSLTQAINARMKDRAEGLQKALAERAAKEVADSTAILTELRESILAQLREPEGAFQLPLFTTEEREQLERNRSSLQARVEQIPGEIDLERKASADRYEDPKPQLFPVAIMYLVPRKMAAQG